MTIDRNTFESIYAGQPRWEIGRPQKAFLNVADQITGSILDSGCGTGENAFFFASRGHKVTGIDFLEEPINRAKQKAAERGLTATFLVMDALALKDLPEVFDNVIDSGLFHVFSDDDRRRYVEGLATVLKPGGRLFFLCFSDEEPGEQGPRRVSRKEIEDAFAEGWAVVRLANDTLQFIQQFFGQRHLAPQPPLAAQPHLGGTPTVFRDGRHCLVERRREIEVAYETEVHHSSAERPDLGNLEEATFVIAETPHGADDVAVAPVFAASLHRLHLIEDVVVRRVDAQFHEKDAVPHDSALGQLTKSSTAGELSAAELKAFAEVKKKAKLMGQQMA